MIARGTPPILSINAAITIFGPKHWRQPKTKTIKLFCLSCGKRFKSTSRTSDRICARCEMEHQDLDSLIPSAFIPPHQRMKAIVSLPEPSDLDV